MTAHWRKLVADAETRAESYLATLITDPESPARGCVSTSWGIPDPRQPIWQGATAMACYLNPDSRLYRDARIPEAYALSLEFAFKSLNPDDTLDYPYNNFRSAPDTAFITNRMFVTRGLVSRACPDPALDGLLARMDEFLERAGRGVMSGGFHTPNHRWVCAANLSLCHKLTGRAEFKTAAEKYLLEGIDGNPDGEYAERSSGGYNIVNNEQMIFLAEARDDPSFLDYVERNLEMMFAYIDPDGSVFTENSTRQDRGNRVWPEEYFCQYLYMAAKRNRPDFAAMARTIMDTQIALGRPAPDHLDMVMLRSGGIDYGTGAGTVPSDYSKLFRESGVVRVRHGEFGYSLLKNNAHFLHFQSGKLRASMRIGVGFFERRDFIADTLAKDGNDFTLGLDAKGWYYLPFREKPGTSDWWAMDNKNRERLPGVNLDFRVTVSERKEHDGIDARISVRSASKVPFRVEICLTPGAELESEHVCLETRPGEAMILKDGTMVLRDGMDALSIGPAFARHRNMSGTYGSDTRSRSQFTVYFTGIAPEERIISFKRIDPRRNTP